MSHYPGIGRLHELDHPALYATNVSQEHSEYCWGRPTNSSTIIRTRRVLPGLVRATDTPIPVPIIRVGFT